MGSTQEAYSIDVYKDDGCCCSSDEVFVMSMEHGKYPRGYLSEVCGEQDIQFQVFRQLMKTKDDRFI